MGEEERTGPIWYLRLTRFDDPSYFLEAESGLMFDLRGSFGFMNCVVVSSCCCCCGVEVES